MISRVTNLTTMHAAQRNLQAGATKMARLQDQASSQTRDQPALGRPGRHRRVACAFAPLSDPTTSTPATSTTAKAGSPPSTRPSAAPPTSCAGCATSPCRAPTTAAMSPTAKEAIAVELEGLKDDLHGAGQREVCRAHRVRRQLRRRHPPSTHRPTSFSGAGNGPVDRRIGDDTTVRVDADGTAVFGTARPRQQLRVRPAR